MAPDGTRRTAQFPAPFRPGRVDLALDVGQPAGGVRHPGGREVCAQPIHVLGELVRGEQIEGRGHQESGGAEVEPGDPVSIFVVALLILVATIACLVPAWRTSRVDFIAALRSD
jgi:hypothetical protein